MQTVSRTSAAAGPIERSAERQRKTNERDLLDERVENVFSSADGVFDDEKLRPPQMVVLNRATIIVVARA